MVLRSLLVLLSLFAAYVGTVVARVDDDLPADARRVIAKYGELPLLFEPAADRTSGMIGYIGRTLAYAVAIAPNRIRLAPRFPGQTVSFGVPVTMQFVDADSRAAITGLDEQTTRIHRIRSDRDAVDIPAYGRVRIAGLYPDIDAVFYGHGSELEYDLVVAPGGDPASIRIRIDDTAKPALDATGNLALTGDGWTLALRKPVAYQDADGLRRVVDCDFRVDDDGILRFVVGRYDRRRPLVIDPVVSYATYIGGNSFEQGTAIAVDSAGSAYVTGYTSSSNFPLQSAYDRSIGRSGDVDVFVSKLNPSGTALVWSTYIGGGNSVDRAIGIAVDAAGNAYITGRTTGADFPVSATAWQKGTAGGGAFVTKLGAAGNTLAYSTYIAGVTPSGIAVDASGNAYVVGSATPAFAATPGALQASPRNTAGTGFLLKLNPAGTAPVYATFLGGSGSDYATAVAVDSPGNAYVAGWTTSSDFPTASAFQPVLRGSKDSFVAKIDPSGSRLVYGTLLGGSLDDVANALAIDAGGSVYVAGETYSSDFPVRNGFQMQKAGARLVNSSLGNAFVAKLAPPGNALVYASFLGGEICMTPCQLSLGSQPQFRGDAAYGIAVDTSGHAFVSGIARSYTFPLIDSTATRKQEDTEDSSFVSKVTISGSALLWSTFLRTGFNEGDNGWTRFPPGAATGIATDPAGSVYITGDSDQFSNFQPTPGAFQTGNNGSQAAIVVKLAAAPSLTLATSNDRVDALVSITLTATLSGPALSGDVVFVDGGTSIGSAPLTANKAMLTTTLPVGIHAVSAVLYLPGLTADAPVLYQIVDAPLVCI